MLIWSHWIWFFVPHATAAYLLLRHRDRFPRGACLIYGTFDLGLIGYWAVPTAPPWYAAARGRMSDGRTPELRRMMVEYGERFWKSSWGPLYGFLGGNPLAAMPSLHFATSVMAAHLLSETGPVAGAVGWTYTGTLGVALVYLGEHYVVDLAVGLALTQAVRKGAPLAAPLFRRIWRRGQAARGWGPRVNLATRHQTPNQRAPEHDEHEEHPPRLEISARNLAAFLLFVVLALVALYFLLPQIAGLEETWHRLEDGNPVWLGLALLFTFGMFGGYVLLFHGVFARAAEGRLTARESYQVWMAGLAATRLFSAGGAGGIVLTAWALRGAGLPRRVVADKTISFLVLTYLVYIVSLVVFGFGLCYGVFPGPAPFTMTVIPATLALIVTVLGLSIAFVPTDFERRLQTLALRHGRVGRLAQRLATVPATASSGIRDALAHLRSRDPALLGAIVYWACHIAVLWACFHAFGDSPPLAVLVLGFFVGMLGNLLPLPGGIGGVDGGMIGAFAAFGVDTGLAVVAVLAYRAFTFWLPTIPGVIAYFQLRRTVERWRDAARRRATLYKLK